MRTRPSGSPHYERPRHPFPGARHPIYRMLLPAILLLLSLAAASLGAETADEPGKEKRKRTPEFIITGTVFTEKGYLLPGAEIRVNRTGERKSRWEAISDRRGEFGIRVPPGAEYEVKVKAKGYQEQKQKVNGKAGTAENLTFRMAPETGGKKR